MLSLHFGQDFESEAHIPVIFLRTQALELFYLGQVSYNFLEARSFSFQAQPHLYLAVILFLLEPSFFNHISSPKYLFHFKFVPYFLDTLPKDPDEFILYSI